VEKLSIEMKPEWYRQMCLIRAFEQALHHLNKAGLVCGTAHLYIGMEAIAVGACAAMKDEDLLTSTHRGHGHCLARGLDAGRMMAEILGRTDGYCGGKGGSMHIADISRGMLGADGIVGGGIPIAVGAALGRRLRNTHSVVFCFFGEGASNQGSFHEALNLAAVQQLPVVFVCENNLWALSAPFAEVTAGGSVSNRSAGYGMFGAKVDGNDVEAVFTAVSQAAERARSGAGPSLLECETYRWEGHSVFTRQEIRREEEIQLWKKRDPIGKYRTKLIESGQSTGEVLDEIESKVANQISEAIAFAKSSPVPDSDRAFQGTYA
jgi:TPP-dependent pyruvate/acetoin dehydrogenase alpha subunit